MSQIHAKAFGAAFNGHQFDPLRCGPSVRMGPESFVFDAGMGCQINYTAMQVPSSKMRRIFLTHLHGDHTSEIRVRRAVVSDFADAPLTADPRAQKGVCIPKYNDPRGIRGGDFEDPSSPYWPLGLGPLEQLSAPFLTDQVVDACLYDPGEWECATSYTAYSPPEDPPGV